VRVDPVKMKLDADENKKKVQKIYKVQYINSRAQQSGFCFWPENHKFKNTLFLENKNI